MPCSMLHTQVFKRKDLLSHAITSLSVSRTYLPVNHPVWEALIWEMEYDCRQWGSPVSLKFWPMCALRDISFFVYQYASVSYKNTYSYCPVDPESYEQVQLNVLFKPFQAQNADPLRQLWPVSPQYRYSTVLTGWQFITHMKGSDLPCLSAELSQVKFCRFPKVGELQSQTWLGGREEGREYAVIISLSLQDVSGMVLGASVWLLPMTVLEEA